MIVNNPNDHVTTSGELRFLVGLRGEWGVNILLYVFPGF